MQVATGKTEEATRRLQEAQRNMALAEKWDLAVRDTPSSQQQTNPMGQLVRLKEPIPPEEHSHSMSQRVKLLMAIP